MAMQHIVGLLVGLLFGAVVSMGIKLSLDLLDRVRWKRANSAPPDPRLRAAMRRLDVEHEDRIY